MHVSQAQAPSLRRVVNAEPVMLGLLRSRAAVVLVSLIYSAVLYHAHAGYLETEWPQFGFTHFAVAPLDGLMVSLLVAIGALFVPSSLQRPSSIVLLVLFAVVYVPTMVITVGTAPDAFDRHRSLLGALALAFAAPCLAVRLQAPSTTVGGVPGRTFVWLLLAAWAGCCVVLVASYGSMMRFVGEEQLYVQRAAGASTSLAMGYAQTYFANVLNPALVAVGLVKRRWWLVWVGIAGCLVMYMINAQRTVLALPVVMIGLYFMLLHGKRLLSSTAAIIGGLAGTVQVSVSTYQVNGLSAALGQYLVCRTLAGPGLTLSQYYEVFSIQGYTWWSHVRGISAFVPAPVVYANDAKWPYLGYFIGDWYHASPTWNINAHIFSADGVASAGALGVIVMGAVLALWLLVLDRACRGWDRTFTLLVLLPIAVVLTNGSLFTTLLSFGGLFWTALFLLYKPRLLARPAPTLLVVPASK